MSERLLTPAHVAERCQISTKTVLRAIRSGRLRASRLGEHAAFRLRPEDVEAWIDESVFAPPVKAVVEPTPLRRADRGRLTLTSEMGRSAR